jgi:putative glutamine amidotransferase
VSLKIVIGIADCSKYTNYEKWIAMEPGVEVIKLGYVENNIKAVAQCDGILLTGGEDVCPAFYDQPENLKYCDPDNMDEKRDEFELKVLALAGHRSLPVLGICRGLQITNVFFGGTLIPDIPQFTKSEHAKFAEGDDRYHSIKIDADSQLERIAGVVSGEVNSAHHQSADAIGDGLVATAFSAEGIVEAIERAPGSDKPFLLLVQWHPERMKNLEDPLTKKIKQAFLESVRNKKLNHASH